MKLIYLDCGMGAAGDMLTAALLELLPDKEAFLEMLNGIGIPNVRYEGFPDACEASVGGSRLGRRSLRFNE